MEAKKKRMQELVELLNRARRAYEQEDTEIMSNYEYDRLYDELEGLERELGTTLASSPTVNVGVPDRFTNRGYYIFYIRFFK